MMRTRAIGIRVVRWGVLGICILLGGGCREATEEDDSNSIGSPLTSTFGRTSAGSPITASADYKRASRFTLANDNSELTALSAYLDGLGATTGSQAVRAAVYADAGGQPGARLCLSSDVTIVANTPAAWVAFPLVGGCALAARGNYWLALHTGPTAAVARYYGGTVVGALRHAADPFADGVSDPFGAASSGDVELAIYATYRTGAPCVSGTRTWTGQALATQSGTFRTEFDSTPSSTSVNGVVGLSSTLATDYPGLAAILRFNASGFIDARNGGDYGASTIPYAAGVSYHARLEVNVPAHTYSAYVTPAGGSEVTVGSNYAFRTEQAGVANLADWNVNAQSGTLSVCNFTSTATAGPTNNPSICTASLSPGAAIAPAFNALSPGGVLCLHTGSYGSPTTDTVLAKSGTAGHPITLRTFPGEAPATIEGAFEVGVNNATGHQHYVTVSHLNFKPSFMNGRVNGTSAGCTASSVRGVQLNGGDITFEYNEISEASTSPQYRDTALGVNFQPGLVEPNIVIRKNKIHDYGACDNYDHGMYLDFISSGEVSGNWIWNGGCSYGAGGGNHGLGCGAGIQLWVAPIGLAVHGNVIDGTGVGLFYSGSNNSVYDNVIVNMRGMFYSSGSMTSVAAYNGYGGSSSNTFHDNDWFNAGMLCDTCTATSTNNVSVNPMFVDAANHNYALQAGSPVATYQLWDGTGR